MAEDERPLTSREFITKQYEAMQPLLKLGAHLGPDMAKQISDIEAQFLDLKRMEEERVTFAKRFAPLGWTVYDRLSVELIRTVVSQEDAAAEQALLDYHLNPDQLEWLGYRFHVSRYEAWQEIYQRAVDRALDQDYLSAVPLILIIVDGIGTTTTGKHPFSGGADAPVFDSETAGPGGIAEGLAILGATRRKLDTKPIFTPYRHGIVHGLNPNFGNPLVTAKAFNLLQAVVDYFDRRADEDARLAKAVADQKPASLLELAEMRAQTEDMRRRIDAWAARPKQVGVIIASSDGPVDVDPSSPEATAAEYMSAITALNFGHLAASTIDYPLRSVGARAGRHRQELGDLRITSWRIVALSDESPAVSEVVVDMEGTLGGRSWRGEETMRLIFGDAEYRALTRGAPGGRWSVLPNFLPKLWGTALRDDAATKDDAASQRS